MFSILVDNTTDKVKTVKLPQRSDKLKKH